MKLDSMMDRDTFADYDDFFLPQRERLPSDTCMSSSGPISAEQFPEENFEASLMIETESLSDNLIDAASCIKDTTYTVDDDNQEIFGGPNEESDNLISNLRPVQVPNSNENSSENSTAVDEEKPEPVLKVSREGKRKLRATNTPANLIQHQVRRRKKTSSQVDYLKSLFHKLGGKWNG